MPNEIGIKRAKEPTLYALDRRQAAINRYLDAVHRQLDHLRRGEYAEADAVRETLSRLNALAEQECRRLNDRYPLA